VAAAAAASSPAPTGPKITPKFAIKNTQLTQINARLTLFSEKLLKVNSRDSTHPDSTVYQQLIDAQHIERGTLPI
jgi:hypothetical protein